MPIQKTDRNTTWNVGANDQIWTLATNAKITVENQNGIDESGFSGSEIKVLGDIAVTGNFAAVHLTGSASSALIGKDSRINAKNAESGIFSEGAGAEIVNRGHIEAGDHAIFAEMGSVTNYGTIKGGTGIGFGGSGAQIQNHGDIVGAGSGIFLQEAGSLIENHKGAEIAGGSHGIFTIGIGQSEIVNRGVVRGGHAAIVDGQGNVNVTNIGKIIGDVSLGDGMDMIDTRKGIVRGDIEGGDGSDTYKISNAKTKILEYDAGTGTDEVQSTVSYRLADNVETLRLIGKTDTNATGNVLDNSLHGNKGDNRLSGMAGEDFLQGGRGNDILKGGVDADVFIFSRTDDADRIEGFEDGMDRLYIEGVYNQATFDELDIRQAKGDVIIDFGHGNEIRIEDMTKANFTFDDMILLA
jgi:Ca2+-binding RTX toxin-like protein